MTIRLKITRSRDSLGRRGWRWECAAHPRPRSGFHRDHTWIDFMAEHHGLKPRQSAQARCMDAARAHLSLRHPEEE